MSLSPIAALSLFLTTVSGTGTSLSEGLGPHVRRISTRSAEAQKQFNRGLNFIYAFNHDEARQAFEAAAKADPRCAMAYWGIAATHGPHINNTEVPPDQNQAGHQAARKALALSTTGTSAEKAMIAASARRFAVPPPKDRAALNKAYMLGMRSAWKSHPKDADIGALYAESLMDLWPWNLWKPNGKPQPDTNEIVRTLELAMKLNPRHPFALHLYIHTVEASPDPYRGIKAADTLRFLQPALGHNVHMPSHIDVRTGRWKHAVEANVRAMRADAAYRKIRPRIGFYQLYMAHNFHMLAFAAMMRGQSQVAIATIDALMLSIPEQAKTEMAPILDGFMSMPIEVRKRFGKWDQVLAAPEPGARFPVATAMRHAARAVAYAAKGMPDQAELEEALFTVAAAGVPDGAFFGNNSAADLLKVAEKLMVGEIRIAQKRNNEALAALREAVRAEDALRYDEPPDWILPTRHTLGAFMISLGRHAEAVQVYRDDLKKWPENGWSLFGLAEALKGQGKSGESAAVRTRFAKTWADADMTITSSCMCLPGK
jgi:tetratricopeptide (TPR) repeat protein